MPQVPAKAARFASFGRYLGALRPRMVPPRACKTGEIRVARRKFVAAMSNKMISRALSKFAQRSALLAPRSTAIPHLRFENRTLDCF
jgi:hypothetical protein